MPIDINSNTNKRVLVTGGSGFVAAHCILQLLAAGYRVRTTVRNLEKEQYCRAMLRVAGAEPGEMLSFVMADLLDDAGWDRAVNGCEYMLHVASPFPATVPKDENELIRPAREGALRVLKAAKNAGVKRVVMTSSFAAIGYGKDSNETYTEESWTDTDQDISPYTRSKTLAELAAWEFIKSEGGSLELAVVNPVGILGPVLGSDLSSSILLIKRLMDGSVPGCPRLSYSFVDVRDVADLHLRAMTNPAAKGERFLAVSGKSMPMVGMAGLLKARLGNDARKVPTRTVPDWMVKLMALFDSQVAQVIPDLGKEMRASSEKARRVLGWNPRPVEESVIDTAESLLRLGILKSK
jgi:nucleoside-diphosphate-sugar epimerase